MMLDAVLMSWYDKRSRVLLLLYMNLFFFLGWMDILLFICLSTCVLFFLLSCFSRICIRPIRHLLLVIILLLLILLMDPKILMHPYHWVVFLLFIKNQLEWILNIAKLIIPPFYKTVDPWLLQGIVFFRK